MDFKVFVSYSTKDLDHVEALRAQLANTPLKLFVAEHSVIPGEDLSSKIKSSISTCDLFVLVWSKNAKESGWVSQEIGQASAFNKQILPLVLDEEHAPEGFVSNLKYIQAYKSISEALSEAKNICWMHITKKALLCCSNSNSNSKKNPTYLGLEQQPLRFGFSHENRWRYVGPGPDLRNHGVV